MDEMPRNQLDDMLDATRVALGGGGGAGLPRGSWVCQDCGFQSTGDK